MKGHILVIDDEPQMGPLLQRALGAAGHFVECFQDPEDGLQRLRERRFDLLVTDLCMPGLDGLEVLGRARAIRPDCEVVVMTAHATVASARTALKHGAADYLTKPFGVEHELLPLVSSILAPDPCEPREEAGSSPIADTHAADTRCDFPVGGSAVLQRALQRARKVAASTTPVLLLGESGTGKEIFAELVHELSPRRDRPLLRVNCAALSESLLESELFGHVRGSFTGAMRDREGIFAAADGGTLFLDEIGELSPNVQPKLLRVLQHGEIQRVGEAGRASRVDVRVIAATNRSLRDAVASGRFREDLYYRLAVVPLLLPPLRERREDVDALIEHFLARLKSRARFSPAALAALQRYGWPGNVRELANAVEHAVVLGSGPVLEVEDLPAAIQEAEQHHREGTREEDDDDTLESIEQRTILQTLARTRCNRTEAARLLGVTRRTLGYRIRKYGLEGTVTRLRADVLGAERTAGRAKPLPGYAGSV